MGSENAKTLQAYEAAASEYASNTFDTVEGSLKIWLDEIASQVAKDARILEIGSGAGRDALYLLSQGYQVECSDGAAAMVDLLRENGLSAKRLNILTDPLDGPWDLILANCVLLHFDEAELGRALDRIREALSPAGYFAVAMKAGDKSLWETEKSMPPRFMRYWQEAPLRKLLEDSGFEIVSSAPHLPEEADRPRVRMICRIQDAN